LKPARARSSAFHLLRDPRAAADVAEAAALGEVLLPRLRRVVLGRLLVPDLEME
jgi:hypothetical protein